MSQILQKVAPSFLRLHYLEIFKKTSGRWYGVYEPDYLDAYKPKTPVFDDINIQIKGYDFPKLEKYQKLITKIANNMNFDLEYGWAIPPQHLKVVKYKSRTTVTETEYKLLVYERNIRILNMPSTTGQIFIEAIETAIPEGVTLTVRPHLEEYEEIKYVPDLELLELKGQLEELTGEKK